MNPRIVKMKTLSLALLLGFNIQMIQAQTRFDELANLPFSEIVRWLRLQKL